jgi:hypothetical protein
VEHICKYKAEFSFQGPQPIPFFQILRRSIQIDGVLCRLLRHITQGREVLPANVKPVHYDLTLEPDFANFTYQGTVTIEYVPVRPYEEGPADTRPV